MNLPSHMRARALYLLDVLVGRARGTQCPSCGSGARVPLVVKFAGLASIFQCARCKLLFRPTGLFSPAIARWYYSSVYSQAGVATSIELSHEREALARAIAQEGKDRSAVVQTLRRELPAERQRTAVFGCSWGYEIELLRRAGIDAFGIELSKPRREFAIRELGLEVYESLAAAGRNVRDTGVLMSSHVLEHIPRLDSTLREIDQHLAPSIQWHIVPAVELDQPLYTIRHVVGREHPLGVTGAFWQGWASAQGFVPELTTRDQELWCTLRRATHAASHADARMTSP
jgi:hypothetical protein